MVTMRPEVAALPGGALKVCLALACHTRPDSPRWYIPQKDLALELGVGERQLRNWLSQARAAGAITWKRRKARSCCVYDLAGFWAIAHPERPRSIRREVFRIEGVNPAGSVPVNPAGSVPDSINQTSEETRTTNQTKAAPSAPGRLIPSESSGGTARPEVVDFLKQTQQLSEKTALAIAGEKPGWGPSEWRVCNGQYEAWLSCSDLRPENRAGHFRAFVRSYGGEVVATAEAARAEEEARREKRRRARERQLQTQRELERRPAESVAEKARGVLEGAAREGRAVPSRIRERLEAVAAQGAPV